MCFEMLFRPRYDFGFRENSVGARIESYIFFNSTAVVVMLNS